MSTNTKRSGTDADLVAAWCVNTIEIVQHLKEKDSERVTKGLSAKAKLCLTGNSQLNWDQAYYACSLDLLNIAKRSVAFGKTELKGLLELNKRQEIEEREQEEEEKKRAKASKMVRAQEGTRKSDRLLYQTLKDE